MMLLQLLLQQRITRVTVFPSLSFQDTPASIAALHGDPTGNVGRVPGRAPGQVPTGTGIPTHVTDTPTNHDNIDLTFATFITLSSLLPTYKMTAM